MTQNGSYDGWIEVGSVQGRKQRLFAAVHHDTPRGVVSWGDDNPAAAEFFATLKGTRRYSFIYRIHDAKRPETRQRRISKYVEMLRRGERIHD